MQERGILHGTANQMAGTRHQRPMPHLQDQRPRALFSATTTKYCNAAPSICVAVVFPMSYMVFIFNPLSSYLLLKYVYTYVRVRIPVSKYPQFNSQITGFSSETEPSRITECVPVPLVPKGRHVHLLLWCCCYCCVAMASKFHVPVRPNRRSPHRSGRTNFNLYLPHDS